MLTCLSPGFPKRERLHNLTTTVKARKLMLIWHCQPTFLIGFHSWLFWPRLHSVLSCHAHFISYNLRQFLSPYLLFLTLLKSTSQGLCRMAFNLGLSAVSSGLDSGTHFGKNAKKGAASSEPWMGRHGCWCGHFDHLVKALFAQGYLVKLWFPLHRTRTCGEAPWGSH